MLQDNTCSHYCNDTFTRINGGLVDLGSTCRCPFVEEGCCFDMSQHECVCQGKKIVDEILASFPGARKSGGSTWYTLFAHAQRIP